MSSHAPANVSVSLEEFSKHGGLTAHHKDGWGIVYYHDKDAQIIREPFPAFDSAQMQFVKHRQLESTKVISHIRKATLGEPALKNTQPFSRELCGRLHIFAHNGMFADIISKYPLNNHDFQCIGETDSEHAFCLLLEQMKKLWQQCDGAPKLEDRLRIIREFANLISALGPANFIYSDGDYIYCHGDQRTHSDGMRPPGLFALCRSCTTNPKPMHVAGMSIVTEAESQDIALVASVPLTDEHWEALSAGEIIVLQAGFVVKRDIRSQAQ